MSNVASQIKTNGISRAEVFSELDAEYGLERDRESWLKCYFHRVGSDLLHSKGECMVCDWKRHINSVREEDVRNWSFIEAWEWHDIWMRKYSAF